MAVGSDFLGMKRTDRYSSFKDSAGYNKNAYQYNGYAGGDQDEKAKLRDTGYQADQRAAPQINQGASDQSRNYQYKAMDSMAGAAAGTAPSKAEQLGQLQADRAARAQVSAAGTVRGGPGAQAAAYRAASQGAAQQQADAAQGIQAQRADEMATARRDLAGASTGARGQDLAAATNQAQLDLNSRNANDARSMGYEQMAQKVGSDQLQAQMHEQQLQAGVQNNSNALNATANQANAETNAGIAKGVMGAVSGLAGGALNLFDLSDPDAKEPIGGSLAEMGMGGMPESGGGGGGGLPMQNLKKFADPNQHLGARPGSGIFSPSTGSPSGLAGILGMGQPMKGPGAGGAKPGGIMMSGMMTKEPDDVAMSSEETKRPAWLDKSMRGEDEVPYARHSPGVPKQSLDEAMQDSFEGANPYERDPEMTKGAAGAPRGYASSRAGQPGYMFGDAPEADSSVPGLTQPDQGSAPGTDDYAKYGGRKESGTKAKDSQGREYVKHGASESVDANETDWTKGGSTKKPEKKKGTWQEMIMGGLNGLSGRPPRDTTTSDPKAKEEAYQKGVAAGLASGERGPRTPHEVQSEDSGKPKSAHDGNRTKPRTVETTAPKVMERTMGPEGEGRVVRRPVGPEGVPTSEAENPPGVQIARVPIQTSSPQQTTAYLDAVARGATQGAAAGAQPSPFQAAGAAAMRGATQGASAGARSTTPSDPKTKRGFREMSDDEMAGAMRSMEPSPYRYKSGFDQKAGQEPGEVNVGPMADKMARDPVARTAIVKDEDTGMLAIDTDKALKLTMGSLAALQDQVDGLDRKKVRK